MIAIFLKRSLKLEQLQLDLLDFLQNIHLAPVDAITQCKRNPCKEKECCKTVKKNGPICVEPWAQLELFVTHRANPSNSSATAVHFSKNRAFSCLASNDAVSSR